MKHALNKRLSVYDARENGRRDESSVKRLLKINAAIYGIVAVAVATNPWQWATRNDVQPLPLAPLQGMSTPLLHDPFTPRLVQVADVRPWNQTRDWANFRFDLATPDVRPDVHHNHHRADGHHEAGHHDSGRHHAHNGRHPHPAGEHHGNGGQHRAGRHGHSFGHGHTTHHDGHGHGGGHGHGHAHGHSGGHSHSGHSGGHGGSHR